MIQIKKVHENTVEKGENAGNQQFLLFLKMLSYLSKTAYIHFHPLPDDKILHWSKLNQIADDIFKVQLKYKISAT